MLSLNGYSIFLSPILYTLSKALLAQKNIETWHKKKKENLLVAFLTQPVLLFFALALVAFIAQQIERKKDRKREKKEKRKKERKTLYSNRWSVKKNHKNEL
jgi:hypothetical protein